MAEPNEATCDSACSTAYLAKQATPDDICKLSLDPIQAREKRNRCPQGATLCKRQCLSREMRIVETRSQLDQPCKRRSHFSSVLLTEPAARRVIGEEEAELEKLYRRLRQLQGPEPTAESRSTVQLIAVTCGLGLAALYAFGRHARHVGIRRCRSFRAIRTAFLATSCATLLVAVTVILIESLARDKTGFDWSSFCVNRNAFWINHASVLPLTLLVATQLSAGFYAMRAVHVPEPDPTKVAWGVRAYVTFLETWCFSMVVIAGAVAAIWLHELAAEPTHTNLILSFLGWGALGSLAVLAVRALRTAMTLRDRCETLALTASSAPDLPTEALLGKSWWQAPAVFVAASSIALWLLEKVDAIKLYTPP